MPTELNEKLKAWLADCPYAEFYSINTVDEDSSVYVVNIDLAVEKEG